MARAGDQLVNAATGHRLVFRRTAADTDGALVEVESVLPVGQATPPDHLHPIQEERIEVVAGIAFVRLGGVSFLLRPGDVLVIPPGVHHAIGNGGGEDAHLVSQTSPALQTEAFLETTWGLAQLGKTDRHGVPGLLQRAVMTREFGNEVRSAPTPWAVQRAVAGLLAPLARFLGYRPRHRYHVPYTRRPAAPPVAG